MNPSGQSNRRILVAIVAMAILVRVIAAVFLGDQAAPVSGAYDQVSYDMLAQRLAAGMGFTFPTEWYPFTPPDQPTAHWSFLYTLYLAGIYDLFGHHPLIARLVQVLLSGLQCWLAYRLGRRLFGEWTGIAAAALTAGYAYFIFFNAALMTQTFYILALLLSLLMAVELAEDPQSPPSKWVILGLALGIAALMRQTILLFTPIILVLLWRANRQSPKPIGNSRLLLRFLIPLSIIAALVLPWTIRNYIAYHDLLLLNSNSGFWLYSSNHPNQGTHFDSTYVAPIPADLAGLAEPALDRALLLRGIGFILADPIRFVLLSIDRFKDYFWLVPSERSSLLSNLSRLLSFALYLPFMLYGLFLSFRSRRACWPLYLYVAFDTLLCLLSWSAPRYRLPSDAIMMVFAGLAGVDLLSRMGMKSLSPGRFSA